jgi:hypothetical protein
MKFTEINYQGNLRGTDFMWGVHVSGCADILKEIKRQFGYVTLKQASYVLTEHDISTKLGSTVAMRDLLDTIVDGETRDLGWGDEHVKVHACVKQALSAAGPARASKEERVSKAGTTIAKEHPAQAKMRKEREAMVAKERARIEAEDKKRFAAEEKQAKVNIQLVKDATAARRRADEERERMEQAARERRQATQMLKNEQGKTPRVKGEREAKGKSTAHADYVFGRKIEDDDEFTAEMAKVLRKDASLTWAGVLVEMRKAGIAGGTKRAARLFGAAQSQAVGSKPKNGKVSVAVAKAAKVKNQRAKASKKR